MGEAILDTGPPLHLHEISRLKALGVFDLLTVPNEVRSELSRYGVWAELVERPTLRVSLVEVSRVAVEKELENSRGDIQLADAEVLACAREAQFDCPVLTDDLALRRLVLASGGQAVGTFGVLLRAFRDGVLDRGGVQAAVDDLLGSSTLHLGREFRRFMKDRLSQLLAK